AESQMLPFSLTDFEDKKNDVINGLAVSVSSQGKLLLVGVRPASMIDQLTEREREVVHWITQGLTYKEVARKIGLAPSTVSNHLYRVYHKLGISSKTELVQLKSEFAGNLSE
ncbi:MAG: helix-turn-helix transcriptional regulator, partial [Pseudomonadales bacterium]|nr:helix-turn-helix transcriptional regulator [Pseudomonadales bacterium]